MRWPDHGDHVPNGPAQLTRHQLLTMAKAILTAEQLEAFRLHAHGVGYQRIGEILGISRDTARDRIRRAHHRIRTEAMTECHDGSAPTPNDTNSSKPKQSSSARHSAIPTPHQPHHSETAQPQQAETHADSAASQR